MTETLRVRLSAAEAELRAAGIPTARVDAEWLLAGLLGVGRAALRLDLDRVLPGAVTRRYAAAVRRRAGREPLQRILGWEEFRGLRLRLTPDVFVPRPETEVLVEWALALLPAPCGGARPLAIDLGTGSGCVACALAAERPDLAVLAVDASPVAAAVARANARALGLGGRVRVVAADLLDPLGAPGAALVVSNPPYLPSGLVPSLDPEVRRHEPRAAIDGGPDGLALIRKIAAAARRALAPGGVLALETAAGAQARAAAGLLAAAGFAGVALRDDLTGATRFVAGRA
ncbi:MAG: peptide chain release factor N(5)-glutamine methyltransferase [Candidatus Rokubacteria bacterium]|nr:peptide chain release factor N(5)-glutamine methyltransferase [Candidatus Rokubacteria bacterium]